MKVLVDKQMRKQSPQRVLIYNVNNVGPEQTPPNTSGYAAQGGGNNLTTNIVLEELDKRVLPTIWHLVLEYNANNIFSPFGEAMDHNWSLGLEFARRMRPERGPAKG